MAALAKILIGSTLGLALSICSGIAPAQAETVKQSAKEKVNWYSAAREIQIVDDRPCIKDFRSLPKQEMTLELPNQPTSGAVGGHGAGCVDSGSYETIPRGGIHLGHQEVAYRGARENDKTVSAQTTKGAATIARPTNTFISPSMNTLPRPPKGSLLRHSQSM